MANVGSYSSRKLPRFIAAFIAEIAAYLGNEFSDGLRRDRWGRLLRAMRLVRSSVLGIGRAWGNG